MAGLTREVIGLVILALMILIVIGGRFLWAGSRPREGSLSSATRGSRNPPPDEAGSQQRHGPLQGPLADDAVRPWGDEPATASPGPVVSAFGPTPVWAGRNPPGKIGAGVHMSADQGPQNSAGFDQPPPGVPLPVPAPRSELPPPVSFGDTGFGDTGSSDSPVGDSPVGDTSFQDEAYAVPGPGSSEAHHGSRGEDDVSDTSRNGIVAVPGNGGYGSKIMHRSNLRDSAALAVPTDWMVVTPMDLVGDAPAAGAESEADLPPPYVPTAYVPTAYVPTAGAPDPGVAQPVATQEATPETTGTRTDAPGQAPSDREVLEPEVVDTPPRPVGPNPFAESGVDSPAPAVGMPSGMLRDLLGDEGAADTGLREP